ncbi:MAG: hypothetical protein IJ242_02165 [Clostridia bacterium]|nr:hypothetical protein [Clostridia bacterium]
MKNVMNTKIRLIICWLLVCCAVLLFSNRGAQTYVFEGETLPVFVESREEAEIAEKEALDLKNLVQAEANGRTNSGVWGGDENEARNIEVSRRAVDENGLNLMGG